MKSLGQICIKGLCDFFFTATYLPGQPNYLMTDANENMSFCLLTLQ